MSGLLFLIKTETEAKENEIVRLTSNKFLVKVKAKPLRGEANKSVKNLLALYFNVEEGEVRLIKGKNTPNKVFMVYF